ncbi:long-chain fatty acid--CoA ligase [Halegenticoccus tardaugens]|uniref:long-chain fatty acid--CoA ligase n=1 Tax=Halegenticoccus tardaugens TaxID=2071624 RepID=UPI00100A70B8|nr:long-chain fatty acid--CoA ligase [Halegenticoccus tardaugens]
MSSSELTLRPFFWRATNLFPETEVVSRGPDGSTRYTYREFGDRTRALAGALSAIGIDPGDRVGTFGWNTHRHYEAYFAIPLMGAQLHTINAVLPDEHVEFIVDDASDEVLLVDPGEPFETVERLWDRLDGVREVIVMDDSIPDTDLDCVSAFDELVADADAFDWPELSEDQPAGMCYTSGTTGRPKGVEYTQKMIYSHAMMVATPSAIGVDESDVVMHVVPMYHVNSWELPFSSAMAGAKQVYPGPSPDAETLARLIEEEEVTLTAGVPTVWITLLEYLDEHDVDVSSLERIVVGGSAAPHAVVRRFEDEHDVVVEHAWGMTETMSIGSVSRAKGRARGWDREARFEKRAKQGLLSPGMEMKLVAEDGTEVPWDGESVGELYVRGPTVVGEYYNRPEANAGSFDEGWLKTGDIATVDEDGYLELVDRAKDVIKSGGEWISSIELENELMEHDDVREAAVIAVPHDRWRERPVACVGRRSGSDLTADDVLEFLGETYPRWWLPDSVVFVEEVPKTATGKFDKKRLRDRYADAGLARAHGDEGGDDDGREDDDAEAN